MLIIICLLLTTRDQNTLPHLGFIGLGHMGSHMVQRLMDAGYHLTVFDRTREKAQEVAQRGANVVETPRELAASCEFLLSCVTNDAALEALMYGSDGALAGAGRQNTFIDMSTVSPEASRHLFDTAIERGVPMIDAAVSGSVPQVEQGSLVIFVGGEQETYQRCKPILDVLGKDSFYMGPSGMGTTMKLVVNTLLGLGLQALAEAIVLGEPVNFALSLMHKDFGLVLNQAAELSVSMPATAAAQQMFAAAQAKGQDEDFSVIIRFMEELAGLSSSSQ